MSRSGFDAFEDEALRDKILKKLRTYRMGESFGVCIDQCLLAKRSPDSGGFF